MNGTEAVRVENRTPPGIAFLLGVITGFVGALIILVLVIVAGAGSFASAFVVEDFEKYKAIVSRVPVGQAERDMAVAQIDQVIERVKASGIGFIDGVEITTDMDEMVKDCEVTADEWPKFVDHLGKALDLLGLPRNPPAQIPSGKS